VEADPGSPAIFFIRGQQELEEKGNFADFLGTAYHFGHRFVEIGALGN
jgi:hypothetical protein